MDFLDIQTITNCLETRPKATQIALVSQDKYVEKTLKLMTEFQLDKYLLKDESQQLKYNSILQNSLKNYQDSKELIEFQEYILNQGKFAAMGEIMDAVAHQWKQPLNTISLNNSTLQAKNKLGTLQSNTIETLTTSIQNQVDHLNITIDEFRNIFKQKKQKVSVNLYKLTEDVLVLLKESIAQNNIQFINKLDKSTYVEVYDVEFKHIVINIINNAKEQFELKKKKEKRIIFSQKQQQNHLIFSITDNAGGIDKNIKKHLFHHKVSSKEKVEGSGMGLYMTKLFCDNMGIKIKASNTQDGASFSIVF